MDHTPPTVGGRFCGAENGCATGKSLILEVFVFLVGCLAWKRGNLWAKFNFIPDKPMFPKIVTIAPLLAEAV